MAHSDSPDGRFVSGINRAVQKGEASEGEMSRQVIWL